jgi:hypothetical protein
LWPPLFPCLLLGSIRLRRKILLLVVLSHIHAVTTTIAVLLPLLLLLDRLSHEVLECSLLIHRVIIYFKGFKYLLKRVEDHIN